MDTIPAVLLGVFIAVAAGILLLIIKRIPYRSIWYKFLEVVKASNLARHSVGRLKEFGETEVMDCSEDRVIRLLEAFGYVRHNSYASSIGTVRRQITPKGTSLLGKRMPSLILLVEILKSGWLRGKVKTVRLFI
jgi:hypothetical protein